VCIGEGEGVATAGFGSDMARFIQRHIADVGFIVAAGSGEIHLAGKGSALPVKGVLAFSSVDHATGDTLADINGVIALARLNRHCRIVDSLKGTGIGDFFIAVTAGINNGCGGAGRDNFSAIGYCANIFSDDCRTTCAVVDVDIGIGGDLTVRIGADTAAFAVMHLNGIAFTDGQIACHCVTIALLKGEAGTFTVNVQNVIQAIFHV